MDEPKRQRIDEFLSKLRLWPTAVWHWLRLHRSKKAILLLGAICALTAIIGLCTYAEYRTNLGAKALGDLLAASNSRRHRAGSLWGRVAAREIVKQSLDTLEILEARSALPAAVTLARFEIDRVPKEGIPAFLAVWRTPLGPDDRRTMPEITQSLRIYRQTLALLKVWQLPDVRYLTAARDQISALYRQTGEFDWADDDSLRAGEADTVRSAVQGELSRVFIDQLKAEERERLLDAYLAGEISQVILQRGAGVYHGEISFVDPAVPPIAFEISPGEVGDALGLVSREAGDER